VNHLSALQPGLATACGSLPHADPIEACALVLDTLPGLPAVPALPRWRPAEGMLGQGAWGIDGVEVAADGSLVVDGAAIDRHAAGVDDTALPSEAFAATTAFLDALAARGWSGPVKLQCTGPVTLGTALVAGGAAPRDAFPAAGAAVRRRARALVAEARRRLPDNPLVVVVDEPSLGAATLGDGPVGVEEAVDLVSGTLGTLEAVAVAGLHCCSYADWGAVLRSGPHLLSLPVEIAASLRPSDLGPFLERGGWVAWGAVPTNAPLAPVDGGGVPRLWRSLAARWHALADGGVDPVLLRRRALVTPACGLARHDQSQAVLALRLTAALGSRVAAGTHDVARRTGG
jgi:methionine synthase II (cobalamin-independent)